MDLLKNEETAYRMWQQKVQRPQLVALGPAVITFSHKPQWRHKGLEDRMAFTSIQPPVLNHVRSNLLHSTLQTYDMGAD